MDLNQLILKYRSASISGPWGYIETKKINTSQEIYFSFLRVLKGI